MKRIAIIGMGAAGVSVLNAMAKFPEYTQMEIMLYSDSETFGTGLPYQADDTSLLLNQTADTMSIDSEDPNDFVSWISEKKAIEGAKKMHFPRTWYGEYLQDVLEEALAFLNPKVIKAEVTDLSIQADGKILLASAQGEEVVDAVHLCMGHLAYQDPYHLKGNPDYIYHPYPTYKKLDQIKNDSRVGIIGTGLTGIDMMRYLVRKRTGVQIHFFSDRGTFSSVRGVEPQLQLQYLTREHLEKERLNSSGFVSLSKMIDWFRLECQEHGVDLDKLLTTYPEGTKEELEMQLEDPGDLEKLQSIIHAMDFDLPEYWLALNEADKTRYVHEYRSLFERFRSPMPRETVTELLELSASGDVRTHQEIKAINDAQPGFYVSLENGKDVAVDYIINATGQNKRVEVSYLNSPLLNNLLNKRILQPEVSGGIQVIWPTSEAVSQRYGILSNLRVHGQLITGIQYGNNTVGLIQKHAYKVVDEMRKQ